MRRFSLERIGGMKVLLPVLALVWAAVFILAVWPAMTASRENAEHIEAIGQRLDSLSDWQRGRMALAGSAELWEQELNTRFDRLFPRQRRVKELFHEIAAAANRSGLDPIRVHSHEGIGKAMTAQEAQRRGNDMGDEMDDMDMDDMDDMGWETLYEGLGLEPGDFPSNAIQAHQLSVEFESEFGALTRFVASLDKLSRAVNVTDIDIHQGTQGASARINLEYYVQVGN